MRNIWVIQLICCFILGCVLLDIDYLEYSILVFGYGSFCIYNYVISFDFSIPTKKTKETTIIYEEQKTRSFILGGIVTYLSAGAFYADFFGANSNDVNYEFTIVYTLAFTLGALLLFIKHPPILHTTFHLDSDADSNKISSDELLFFEKYASKFKLADFKLNSNEVSFKEQPMIQVIVTIVLALIASLLIYVIYYNASKWVNNSGSINNLWVPAFCVYALYYIIPIIWSSAKPDATLFSVSKISQQIKIPFDTTQGKNFSKKTIDFSNITSVKFVSFLELIKSKKAHQSYDKYTYGVKLSLANEDDVFIYTMTSNKTKDPNIKRFIYILAQQVSVFCKMELEILDNEGVYIDN